MPPRARKPSRSKTKTTRAGSNRGKRSTVAAKPPRVRSVATNDTARKFAIEAARLAADLHCHHVILLDVRRRSTITDYLLIASGTSDRQVRSVGDDVEELGKKFSMSRYRRDSDTRGTWLALDFVDVMVHLFDPATRAHYDLEMLWGDAPRVHWQRRK